jgi:hypothetical protein
VSAGGTPAAWWDVATEVVRGNTDDGWTFFYNDGPLVLRETVNGVTSDTSITYNATDHRWWRLRVSGTTVNWETSPDGATWTTRRTKTAGTSVDRLARAQLGCGYSGTAPSPLYFEVDNVAVSDGRVETPEGAMAGVGDGRVAVYWDHVTVADGYRVYRDTVEVYRGQGTGDRGTVAWVDTGRTNSVEYAYEVTAYIGGDESAATRAVRATPIAATTHSGGSRSFDGNDTVRFTPGIEPQEQPNATFLLVIKPDSVRSAVQLLRGDMSPSQDDTDDPFVFRISDAGSSRYALTLRVYNPGSTSTSWAETGITLLAGVWQMVAVTFFAPGRHAPRFHHADLERSVFSHADGDPDHTSTIHPHGTWTIGDGFAGLIALAAVIEAVDDTAFEALDLDAIATAAHAQWDETDEFLGDHSTGEAMALRNAITGTTHSSDEPPGFWPEAMRIAHYDGSRWADVPLATYDGSAWTEADGIAEL